MRALLLGAVFALSLTTEPLDLSAKEKPAGTPATPPQVLASWYGASHQGHMTASGEKFDRNRLTAAHRRYPFGTRLRLTNLRNHRQVEVLVNDRGPYRRGCGLDLSEEAARRLGMIESGSAWVSIALAR